jgi:intermediate peptidase
LYFSSIIFFFTKTAINVCHDTYGSSNLTVLNFLKVRRQVFIAGNSEPRENIAVLDELIDARDEFAKASAFFHTVEHIFNGNIHPAPMFL